VDRHREGLRSGRRLRRRSQPHHPLTTTHHPLSQRRLRQSADPHSGTMHALLADCLAPVKRDRGTRRCHKL
jgi:hypothetical protein